MATATTYVFGYGSLIHMLYNKELVQDPSRPVAAVKIKNLERAWNVCGAKEVFLGVKDKKGSETNGLLFQVSQEELQKLKQRERLYTARLLQSSRIRFYKGQTNIQLQPMDQFICFYPKQKITQTKTHVLAKVQKGKRKTCKKNFNYIQLCLEGTQQIGDEFTYDFLNTTQF